MKAFENVSYYAIFCNEVLIIDNMHLFLKSEGTLWRSTARPKKSPSPRIQLSAAEAKRGYSHERVLQSRTEKRKKEGGEVTAHSHGYWNSKHHLMCQRGSYPLTG